MPNALIERLRAAGYLPPDYTGRGLVNIPATVLDVFGARGADDPPPLTDLDPALLHGVRTMVVILADGLGYGQLERTCAAGDTPYLAAILERARKREDAQLLEATTIFPSTTTAAVTTMNTARTPQEHGNIAYFTWLDEFERVTQMLRWGPAEHRHGSFFDDRSLDPAVHAKVPSIHKKLRAVGARSYVVEPEIFRDEAMTRMHAAEASYVGYLLPSGMGAKLRGLLTDRPWGTGAAYIYAYWAGIDTASHWFGPRSDEHDVEAAVFDRALQWGTAGSSSGDTLFVVTADHGHATVEPSKLIEMVRDQELVRLLRNPIAGEPRLAFLHTDRPADVKAHLARRYPDTFFVFDRDEAIEAGLFGRGDPALAKKRIGEVLAMTGDDRGIAVVLVDGQVVRHRGLHGGMTPDEMRIPVLAWRA